MKRGRLIGFIRACGLGAALLAGGAGAETLDVSLSSATSFRMALTGVEALDSTFSFGFGNRAADFSVGRGLDLSVLGTVNARVDGALLIGEPGLRGRLGVTASASLGPAAATVTASAWTAPLAALDPLAPFAFEAANTSGGGLGVALNARYRLSRDTLLLTDGALGAQPNVGVSGEFRRGDLSYRVGGRVGSGVLGVTGGLTLRRDDVTLAVDALLGPNSLGLTGSFSLAAPLPDVDSSLRAYVAYEPWRLSAEPVRVGVALTAALGPGELMGELRGGGTFLGVRVAYSLPLDAPPGDDPEPEGAVSAPSAP